MKKSKFTVPQILAMIAEYDNGKTAEQISIDHKIPKPTFHGWRQRYGSGKKRKVVPIGGEPSENGAGSNRRIRELEEENSRLKRMYGDLSLQYGILKDSIR